ncbi:hypothetical protein [Rugamonas sp.]|uniref:hypothetical protein n=1 Tax=Rugamonas sp. TaxID=1926287 RepID=UPI0025ED87DF|nr:hypothetical protein [Rugamonas sp.]
MKLNLLPAGSTLTSGVNGTFRCDPGELIKMKDAWGAIIFDTLQEGSPLIKRKAIEVMENIQKATEIVEDSTALFSAAFNKLVARQGEIAAQTKSISGSVRDAQQKLLDGLDKITKTADFPRLERYVEMLERAAAAMQILAELEKSGHLEKFSKAMK